MSVTERQVSGRVVRERVDEGSKSERDAVVLYADDGTRYVLRRQGGPAFGDETLDSLVGQSIRAVGLDAGTALILRAWRSDGAPPKA
ncbi:MAG: hypothetical protein ACJ798_06895 [Phenylobacterium sp.]